MALTLVTAVRNGACDAVVDKIDIGAGTAKLIIQSVGSVTLVENAFSATAFGSATTGVATANAISNGTSGNTGTATKAKIVDKDGTDVITDLTVGTSASNINLSTVTINSGDTVSISSMTVTMPAS